MRVRLGHLPLLLLGGRHAEFCFQSPARGGCPVCPPSASKEGRSRGIPSSGAWGGSPARVATLSAAEYHSPGIRNTCRTRETLPMKLWKTIAVAAAVALAASTAHAQAPEKKDIKLGVGGGAGALLSAARADREARPLQGAGAQRRGQRLQGRLAVADRAGRRLGRRRHRRLRAHAAHAGQGPGHPGRHRARPLSRHCAWRQEGPRRQDQDHRRPQGRQDRRHRARLLHQHDRLVPDGQGGPQARRCLLRRRRRHLLRHRRHPARRDRRHLQRRSRDLQAAVDQATSSSWPRPAPPKAPPRCWAGRCRRPCSTSSATSWRRTPTPCRRSSTPSTRRSSGWTRRRPSRSPRTCRRNTGWATRRSTSAAVKNNLQVYSRDGIVSAESQQALARFPQAVRQGDRRGHHRHGQDLGRAVRQEGDGDSQVGVGSRRQRVVWGNAKARRVNPTWPQPQLLASDPSTLNRNGTGS